MVSLDKIIKAQIHNLNIIILNDNISSPNSIEILIKFILKQKLTENTKKKINQIIKLSQ